MATRLPRGLAPAPVPYRERLKAPWWLWPLALAGAGVAAAELTLGAPGPRSTVVYAGVAALVVAALWWLGRIRIEVGVGPPDDRGGLVPASGGELRVDDARLPLAVVAAVEPIDAAGRRELLGPAAEPLAFVIQRPWIPGGVRVDLTDPADPTPYWFISSRRPNELAAAILAARDLTPSPPI